MIIYKIFLQEEFKYFTLESLDDLKKLENQDYSLINEMNFSEMGDDSFKRGDITVIDSTLLLLFSKKASDVFINNEYLSVKNIKDYKLLVPMIIDSLNHEKSIIDYFTGTKEIKRIRKYVFFENKINNSEIFKLPINSSPIFVTDIFKEKYENCNCTGITFSKIYDSNEEV